MVSILDRSILELTGSASSTVTPDSSGLGTSIKIETGMKHYLIWSGTAWQLHAITRTSNPISNPVVADGHIRMADHQIIRHASGIGSTPVLMYTEFDGSIITSTQHVFPRDAFCVWAEVSNDDDPPNVAYSIQIYDVSGASYIGGKMNTTNSGGRAIWSVPTRGIYIPKNTVFDVYIEDDDTTTTAEEATVVLNFIPDRDWETS